MTNLCIEQAVTEMKDLRAIKKTEKGGTDTVSWGKNITETRGGSFHLTCINALATSTH